MMHETFSLRLAAAHAALSAFEGGEVALSPSACSAEKDRLIELFQRVGLNLSRPETSQEEELAARLSRASGSRLVGAILGTRIPSRS